MTTIHAQQTPETQKYLLIILGFFRRWQRSPLFLGLLTFVAAGGVITAEISNNLSKGIILSLPLAGILVFWNLYVIIKKSEKLLNLFSFPKNLISAPLLIFFILGTCTPALYLSPTWKHHPFNDIHWLVVCLFGLLFLLAFINWNLCRTSQLSTGMYSVFKKLWNMPTCCFLGCVILWILIITCFFSYNVFGNIPHVNDAIAQFFQAKIFATGKLTAALPPIPDFFQYTYDNIIMAERWYSQYPPGHPFFLMLGLLVGAPWITNPIFATLSAILLYKCALLYYGVREARLSTLLYCVSPFVLFMSASFMNHVSTLFFILLALYALKKSLMKNRAGFACLAGFALGIVLNIRTGDSIALFFPMGIYFLICSFRQRQYHLPVYFALCFACMFAILLTYNAATNGDPFLFGYQVRWGQEHSMGFSNVSVMGIQPHTPLRGIIKTLRNLVVLNQNLFEWPFPSFIPLYLLWLPFLFKKNFNDYFFLCCLLTIPVFYFFYFYQDLCLGPRFLYSSLPFIFILTAKSIIKIIDTITESGIYFREGIKFTFITLFCLCVIFAAVVRTPKLYRFYADSFWDVDTKLMEKAKQMSLDNALIFQKSYHKVFTDLGSGFLYNSPTLDSPIVFARDLGRRNIELVPFFAGRTCYLATRDQKNNVFIHLLPFSPADAAAAQFQKAE